MLKSILIFCFSLILFSSKASALSSEKDSGLPVGLEYMLGEWTTETQFFDNGNWSSPVIDKAIVDTHLRNSFIKMSLNVPFPGATFQFEILASYDKFNQEYRFALLDDLNGYLDVYSGQMNEGKLILENGKTGTAFPNGEGGYVYGQIILEQINDKEFKFSANIASESDGTWSPYMKITLKKMVN